MLERTSRAAVIVIAGLAAGCATTDPGGSPAGSASGLPLSADIDMDHALPMQADADQRMLAGEVRVGTSRDLLDFDARYEVRQGKLLRTLHEGGDPEAAVDDVALQVIEQRLSSKLPLPAGGPVELGLSRRQQSKLGAGHSATTSATTADLTWAPGPVDFRLSWSQPKSRPASGRLLDCNVQAEMQLPVADLLPMPSSRLEFTGQRCSGFAPELGAEGVAISRWGATWRWGEERNSALRVLSLQPETPGRLPSALPTPDYELGLRHRHELPGGWEAEANIAVLRGQVRTLSWIRPGTPATTDWIADVSLRRELDLMAITARGVRAPDRRWFATAARAAATERFSLGLDFGAWLKSLWPRMKTAMDVSLDWRETGDGESDGKLSWNFLLGW